MKHRKMIIPFLFAVLLCLTGCGAAPKADSAEISAREITAETVPEKTSEAESVNTAEVESEDASETPLSDVTIVYTNDIHSYVYNTVTDEDGNELPGLRLSNIAAMVEDMRSEGKNVLLVDAGDEVQGSVYGSYDHGSSMIDLMNACGYQLACPGNHEFDYGLDVFLSLAEKAEYPFISCNFLNASDSTPVLPAVEIMNVGSTKIAFVGVTVPSTITTTSSGKDFLDEDGNYLYTFAGIEQASDLYECVQNAVDSIRDQADYVIALSHLGVISSNNDNSVTSYTLIANTEGIDAVIDGHSHTTITGESVNNKNGESVLLTQTGAYLSTVGIMTLSAEGQISTELVTEYSSVNSEVAEMENTLNNAITLQMGETIATLETPLYIFHPENGSQRLIRSREMNAGDYAADAYYWFFNQEMQLDCDIILVNGGGVRCQTEKGDLSQLDMVNVSPFGNQICLIEATGQEILDALESGACVAGLWNEDMDTPAENGGFFQVAGMKYTIDASVESAVTKDGGNNFVSVDGPYRVRNVQVYNRETGTYDDLDTDRIYRVGGTNFILQNGGDGYVMFSDNTVVIDFVGQDNDIMTQYAANFAAEDGMPVVCSENSPLSVYSGYAINYENPYGAGRITIENSDFVS